MIIFCWWRHGEKSITTSWHLFQNTVILRRPRVASFADVIKVATTFIKTIFKDSKKLKESEIMYQNAIYIRISRYSKICWFPVIKCWCQQNLVPIFFGSPLGKVITTKFLHCRICATDFREGDLFGPQHRWAALKRPILNRLKNLFLT